MFSQVSKLRLLMWVPGKLPPNLVFLVTVTKPTAGIFAQEASSQLHPRDPVAADAADEAAHFQDAESGKDAMDGQAAGLRHLVDE